MDIKECLQKLKECYYKIKDVGTDYKRKVADNNDYFDLKINDLKTNYNEDLKKLANEYAKKKCDLTLRYERDLLAIEHVKIAKLVELEVEYQNKRCDIECDITALNNLMCNKDMSEVLLKIGLDNKSDSEQKKMSASLQDNKQDNKTVMSTNNQNEYDNTFRDRNLQSDNYSFKKTYTNAGPANLNENKGKSIPIIEKNNDANFSMWFDKFLKIVNSESWITDCEFLKLNADATKELNKITLDKWSESSIISSMYLVVGRNTNGGGYICSKEKENGKKLIAPSPMAIFTDKIAVSNGFLHYFNISGCYSSVAKVKVIEPAIVEEKDDCFILVKKGRIELE